MEGPEEGRERAPEGRPREEEIPLGQRLYDKWWLLLIAGLLVMLVTYTSWGLVEILTLPEATLP